MISIVDFITPTPIRSHEPEKTFFRYEERYRRYQSGARYRTTARYVPASGSYTWAIKPDPLGAPQTIEEIITSGYFAIPPGDPLVAPVSDSQHTSWLGLDDIITQARERYAVWQQNVDEIERSKLAAMNAVNEWEATYGRAGLEKRADVHNTLQRLYQQEREERVNLWRDLSRMRQMLPEWARQYLSAHRKLALLSPQAGDGQ